MEKNKPRVVGTITSKSRNFSIVWSKADKLDTVYVEINWRKHSHTATCLLGSTTVSAMTVLYKNENATHKIKTSWMRRRITIQLIDICNESGKEVERQTIESTF